MMDGPLMPLVLVLLLAIALLGFLVSALGVVAGVVAHYQGDARLMYQAMLAFLVLQLAIGSILAFCYPATWSALNQILK